MDFTKNTNLSIEEISENKTSGNELSVTKISDSTAEKTFTNNAFSHFSDIHHALRQRLALKR